jgi:hypothetical protein
LNAENGRGDVEPATAVKRACSKARLIAPWILIPLAVQVLGFLLLWHHLSKKWEA